MDDKDALIAAWIAAGGAAKPMRVQAHELLTGALADHNGGLTEHEILAEALQRAYDEGTRRIAADLRAIILGAKR